METSFVKVTKVVWRKQERTWIESPLWLAMDLISNFEPYDFRGDAECERAASFPITRIRLRRPLYDDVFNSDNRPGSLWLTIAASPDMFARDLGVY